MAVPAPQPARRVAPRQHPRPCRGGRDPRVPPAPALARYDRTHRKAPPMMLPRTSSAWPSLAVFVVGALIGGVAMVEVVPADRLPSAGASSTQQPGTIAPGTDTSNPASTAGKGAHGA